MYSDFWCFGKASFFVGAKKGRGEGAGYEVAVITRYILIVRSVVCTVPLWDVDDDGVDAGLGIIAPAQSSCTAVIPG